MNTSEDKQVVWEGNFLRVFKQGRWECVARKGLTGIVGMVAVTDDGRLILIQQYRPALGKDVIELPAGLVGDHPGQEQETLETAARRELLEETGYHADKLEILFTGVTTPGISDEQITFLRATGLKKTAPGGGDSTENITVHEVPLEQVNEWLKQKQSRDLAIDIKLYCLVSKIDNTD